MDFKRSKADPCLYYSWKDGGLTLWISWIDDCLVTAKDEQMKKAKKSFVDRFDCDIVGNFNEYIGMKVDRNFKEGYIRLTQPVLIKSLEDEFLKAEDMQPFIENHDPWIPAEPNNILKKIEDPKESLGKRMMTRFRGGVGKLMHLMRWSRVEMINATRDLSRQNQGANEAHMKALMRAMKHLVATPKRGLLLKPEGSWDGGADYEFVIEGYSDANWAPDDGERKSTSSWTVTVNTAPTVVRAAQQNSVALSTTEAEANGATSCAQDMLSQMRVLESIGLQVKKPMKLWCDNAGAYQLFNNWNVTGRTRHVATKLAFIRELKEEGTISVHWMSGELIPSDLGTKNLARPLFERHTQFYTGRDEMMRYGAANPQDG